MLKVLRRKGVMKRLLWIIAIVIIISFGFLGQSYLIRQADRINYAGKIFGKKISLEDFRRHFEQTQIQAMIQYGDNFNKVKQHLNLESQTWDRIILLHEANRRRIRIADQDVVETVQGYPFFERDGRFDPRLYHNILQHVFRMNPRDFEEGVRETLKFVELFRQETGDVTLSEEEILNAYKFKKEKVQVSYILWESDRFKDQVVFDETRAKDYFAAHKEEFRVPPMINVQYIEINYPPIEDGAALTEADKDATFSRALDVAYALNTNSDFAQVAAEFGLSVNTSGFFSMEQPELKFGWTYPTIQKIFQLKPDDHSEPLETVNGYQIVKVIEERDDFVPDYEWAKEKVRTAWTNDRALHLSRQKAEEDLKTIRATFDGLRRPDFAKIAKDLNLEIYQTPVFVRGEYLPTIGISRDFQDTAFALGDDNRLSDLVKTGKGYCVLHLDSRIPVDERDFTRDKEEFTQQLLLEKKNTVFNTFIARLRLKAQLEDHIAKMMAQAEPAAR